MEIIILRTYPFFIPIGKVKSVAIRGFFRQSPQNEFKKRQFTHKKSSTGNEGIKK